MTRHRAGLVALSLMACAQSLSAQPSTAILVRHAEKAATPGSDPGLSEAGQRRARDLALALADAGVTAIFTTQYQRSALTAAPTALAVGLNAIAVAAGGDARAHAAAVAAAVRGRSAGEVVLVVGHSNTIPAIIRALGGPALPDLCDSQHASLFVLEFAASGPPRLLRARYGAPDRDDESCVPGMRRP